MSGSRIVCRLSSLKLFNVKSVSPSTSPLKSTPKSHFSTSSKRFSAMSRLPVELSCLVSLMPLHSAIASSRLISSLAAESQSWGLIPQGNAMPL